MSKVLIVEDEPKLAELMAAYLTQAGYEHHHLDRGDIAVDYIKNNKVDFSFADSTDDLDIEAIKKQEPLGLSPIDNTPVFETLAGYMSESALDGDTKKGLKISKIILDKGITVTHIQQLLNDGKTELIEGFISKKKRPFDAFLLMDKKGKVTFDFPPRKSKRNS